MRYCLILFFLLGILGIWWEAPLCAAAGSGEGRGMDMSEWEDSLSLEEVDDVLHAMSGDGSAFSLQDYVSSVMDGEVSFSLGGIWEQFSGQFAEKLEEQKASFIRIIVLSVVAGVFMNFAGTVGEKELSDTGFFVTFLFLLSVLTAGFSQVYAVAEAALESLLTFMQALVPSFSLSLCIGAGTGTSLFFYETMLMGISLLEMLMSHVFLPGVQVYFMLCMVNQLAEDRFSRLAELVRSLLRFGVKLVFGVLIGYQGIQGMLVPVMDKVRSNTLLQTAKGLPGVGNTVGSVADTVLGSGMLIKSAVGVGGILAIAVLCFYPLMKVGIYTLLYRLGAALIQPLSDRRVASAVMAAAEAGKLMFRLLSAGALMFILSIAIALVCTNAV